MHCLWCDEAIIPEITWSTVVLLPKPSLLCPSCESHLEKISGNRCRKCSRPADDALCSDCHWWNSHFSEQDPLEFNHSVYSYNVRMQEMVAKWKYRGDYSLGNVFRKAFTEVFSARFSFLPNDVVIVPVPLSAHRMQERAFNQAAMLADFLPRKKEEVLARIHGEKQSKKTRRERIFSENPFQLKKRVEKPVVLVDDIYTTGTTLRHAARILRKRGCPSVSACTLIRG